MAEIVGLVTGIGTIVATAFTIAKTVSTVANDLGTAGSQIKAIATDTKAIAFVLRDLQRRVVKNSRRFDGEAKSVLKETVALCTSEIENMRAHLMPLFQSTEGRKMEFKQRARWLFAKSKVSTTKASLDSMKVTLGLLLHTIEYIEGDIVEGFIEEDIHEMIATSKGTKEKFLKAQRIDMTVEVIYDRIASHDADGGPQDQPQPPSSPLEPAKASSCDEVTSHTMDLAVLQWKSVGMDAGSENQNRNLDSYLTAEFQQTNISTEWSLVEALSDESFLQIADHIRLHKRVTGFALNKISQSENNEGQDFENEQAGGSSDGVQGTEEELSERSYQPARAEDMDDYERQETESMSSVHQGPELNANRRQSPYGTQYTATRGQRQTNNVPGHEQHPQGIYSDAQGRLHGSRSHSNETRIPGSDGWVENETSSPSAFEYSNEGASSSRRFVRHPDHVPGFAPPRASGQEDRFHGNEPSRMSNSYLPAHSQQTGYSSSDRRTQALMEGPSSEMEAMKAQLAFLQEEKKRQEEERKRQEELEEREQRDNRIRKDAERVFQIRMEEMQQAQEMAKREIELTKMSAETAARERVVQEQRLEHERSMERAELLSRIEAEVRQRLEREALERKQRQGLRGLFNRASKS